MDVTGKVQSLSLSELEFKKLKGAERLCAESTKAFEEDENVIVIARAKHKDDSIKVSDNVFFVKEEAFEAFASRLISSMAEEDSDK